MKRYIKVLALLLSISVLLCSCKLNQNGKKEMQQEYSADYNYDVIDKGPVKGGSVRLFSTPIDTLNPVLTNNIFVQDFLSLVFEGLYRLDETQKPVGVLAESMSISQDGLTATIYLKKNVKWHDKMPFTAEDVVFTINTIKNGKLGSIYSTNVEHISSATEIDATTVQLKLTQPYAFIREQLTFPIISLHYFLNEKIADKKMSRNMTPMGTGPYKFNSFDAEAGVRLHVNEDWWGKKDITNNASINNEELTIPYIPTVDVKIFDSITEASSAFQSREVDIIYANYQEFRKYIGRTDITMKRYAGKDYEFVAMNLKKGPLADKRVRQAMNLCLDKKELINKAAAGIAVQAEIPVVPNSWLYSVASLEHKKDNEKAAELMKQSGYVLDKNNIYVNKTTKKQLSLNLYVNDDNILRYNVANELISQLGSFGIKVQLQRVPYDTVMKNVKAGTYDMALMGYNISNIPDLSFAYSSAQANGGLNPSGYTNPEVDNYLNLILTENDSELQKNYYINMINIINEDTPYLGMFFLYDSMMYSKNIKGAMSPNTWNKYYKASEWYVP